MRLNPIDSDVEECVHSTLMNEYPRMTTAPPPAGLYWGIKASFLDYIGRLPDGSVSVGAGALPASGGTIVFSPETGIPLGSTPLRFRGEVHFVGHVGLLKLLVADPWIEISGERAVLSVRPNRHDDDTRVPLVWFTPDVDDSSPRVRIISAGNVGLLEAGAALFNDVYPPGEPFDPLLIVISRETNLWR